MNIYPPMVKLTATLLTLLFSMVATVGVATTYARVGDNRAVGSALVAQVPAPTPPDTTIQPVSPRVIGALICISLLSLSSFVGSFLFKRYFDRLNPD